MADFYTNLPPKEKDNLDKTIERLEKMSKLDQF